MSLCVERSIAAGFTGYVESKGFAYFERATSEDDRVAGWGTLFLRQDLNAGPLRIRVSARGEAITSSERGSIELDPADREPRRSPLSLRELYLIAPIASGVDLQIGRFDLGWGKTDGYSPADAFLPRDMSDPIVEEKLPLWGVRLSGQRSSLRFEAHACLVTTPWRLPVMTGRYSPLSWAGVYLLESDDEPPVRGFETVRATIMNSTLDIGGWVRWGTRPAPLLELEDEEIEEGGDEPVFVAVRRRFVEESGAGIELTRVQGSWVVRGEIAFMRSADPDLGDALIWAISAERAVRDGTFIATAAGNARETPINKAFLFDRAFLPGFILALAQPESWGGWKIVWVGGLDPSGGVLKVDVAYDFSDYWKLTAGADLPHGARISPLGAMAGARRARVALRWSW